jgi:hypothetical protein
MGVVGAVSILKSDQRVEVFERKSRLIQLWVLVSFDERALTLKKAMTSTMMWLTWMLAMGSHSALSSPRGRIEIYLDS